jgi:hypothetical protein
VSIYLVLLLAAPSICALAGWLGWLRLARHVHDKSGPAGLKELPPIATAFRTRQWGMSLRSPPMPVARDDGAPAGDLPGAPEQSAAYSPSGSPGAPMVLGCSPTNQHGGRDSDTPA